MNRSAARAFARLSFSCSGPSLLAVAVAVATACESTTTRPDRPFDGKGAAEAFVAERTPPAADPIRVHSIQRLATTDGDALTAIVNVRNVGASSRTVTVAITWLSEGGVAVEPHAESRETVTLSSQESRYLTFEGAQGARDFKVNLTYPGS